MPRKYFGIIHISDYDMGNPLNRVHVAGAVIWKVWVKFSWCWPYRPWEPRLIFAKLGD